MNNIESAKKLLKKAIDLNDPELISMANTLLDSLNVNSNTSPEPATKDVEKNSADYIFTMSNDNVSKKGGGTPVNDVKKRVNQYVDDGVEAKDLVTPSIQPTQRKRPAFKMIDQTCEKCHKTVATHPTHKRDFFVCDKCLGR
jgi:hypothetical protein